MTSNQLSFFKSVELMKVVLLQNCELILNFKGNSMLPTITSGQVVKLKKVSQFKAGNLYAYVYSKTRSYQSIVCHRLIVMKDEYFYFKGDNRVSMDVPVKKSEIIGEILL